MSLSIIIPAYNAEGFVGATIQSALNMIPVAQEVIVVDDGSKDETPAVRPSFAALSMKIKHSMPNMHKSALN